MEYKIAYKNRYDWTATRRFHAMRMRLSGMTYREIGEELGVGPARAAMIASIGRQMIKRIAKRLEAK